MKTLTLAAALMAVATSVSADINSSGNYVTNTKVVIIQNPNSTYKVGDVIFKRGESEATNIDSTKYSEVVGFNTVIGIDKENNTGEFIKFDKNGNAVIGHIQP